MYRIFLIVILALSGCSSMEPTLYETLQKSTVTKTNITVHWLRPGDTSSTCVRIGAKDSPQGLYAGCAKVTTYANSDTTTCEIFVKQPYSFNNKTELADLGHEVWHCFGARHD